MKVLDPGHRYLPDILDDDGSYETQVLQFVKREGEHYPGNVGHYSGSTIQEVLRCCIDRLKYVNNQIPCTESQGAMDFLRGAIELLEMRAKRVKGKNYNFDQVEIELAATCKHCGHILCTEDHK